MNTTFCMAPWINLACNPDGSMILCCVALHEEEIPPEERINVIVDNSGVNNEELEIGNVTNDSFEDLWNNQAMRDVRLNMLRGNSLPQCTQCYETESRGGFSQRMIYNQKYLEQHIDKVKNTRHDGFVKFSPVELDLRLTNTCNFKCRMCGPNLSSAWERELGKDLPKINLSKIYPQLESLYSDVEEVYFAGGEPLISDHHYEIVKKLNSNVRIRYNTNFSVLNDDIFDIWENFNDVELFISIDGVGKVGEFIRKGFDTKRFLKNWIKFRKRFPTMRVGFNMVVQALNAFHFSDAHEFLLEHNILNDFTTINFTVLDHPEYLSISVLDSETKKEVKDKIIKSKNILQYKEILEAIDNDCSIHGKHFKAHCIGLDLMRNEDTIKIVPELHRLLK